QDVTLPQHQITQRPLRHRYVDTRGVGPFRRPNGLLTDRRGDERRRPLNRASPQEPAPYERERPETAPAEGCQRPWPAECVVLLVLADLPQQMRDEEIP